jgi:putative phosphoribosyl transferase
MYFKDRLDAGRQLALSLLSYKNKPNVIILGLPRGGVIIAHEVASKLQLPLDIICARKVGAPHNDELAIGAITENGEGYFNQELIDRLEINDEYLKKTVEKEKTEAQRRFNLYRNNRPILNLQNSVVILVDDGMATGATMKASIQSLRSRNAAKIIVGVPVSSIDTFEEIKGAVYQVIALYLPFPFYAVGQFYQNFSQTTDAEVIELLSRP